MSKEKIALIVSFFGLGIRVFFNLIAYASMLFPFPFQRLNKLKTHLQKILA